MMFQYSLQEEAVLTQDVVDVNAVKLMYRAIVTQRYDMPDDRYII